jgi:hypothetical protein
MYAIPAAQELRLHVVQQMKLHEIVRVFASAHLFEETQMDPLMEIPEC